MADTAREMATRRILTNSMPPEWTTGEAGVGHLTRPLNGLRFEDIDAARDFARALLDEDVPEIRLHAEPWGSTLGVYKVWMQRVEIGAHLMVGVLVHEVAHHYVEGVCGLHGAAAHGPDFKAALEVLAKEALRILNIPEPEKPVVKRGPRLSRGQRVFSLMDSCMVTLMKPRGNGWWLAHREGHTVLVHRKEVRPE